MSRINKTVKFPAPPSPGQFFRNASRQIRRVDAVEGDKIRYTTICNPNSWPTNARQAGETATVTMKGFRCWAMVEVDSEGHDIRPSKRGGAPRVKPEDLYVKELFALGDAEEKIQKK